MLNGHDLHFPTMVGRRWRILCADDHTMVGDLLVKLFSNAGYEVAHVLDGASALRRIQESPAYFDVLITDHHMPEMTGLELCAALAASSFKGRIIVHSSNISKETKVAYARLGITRVIEKRIASDELVATVDALHDASQQGS